MRLVALCRSRSQRAAARVCLFRGRGDADGLPARASGHAMAEPTTTLINLRGVHYSLKAQEHAD